MTFLVERLAELHRHLDHLERLKPRVESGAALAADLSLHNDVLFSLLSVCQLVIDIAGELSGRAGMSFSDYTGAVRNLQGLGFPTELVASLARLPGFRNVLVHDYIDLDLDRAARALDELVAIREFAALVRAGELGS